jgi:hypothetical protein
MRCILHICRHTRNAAVVSLSIALCALAPALAAAATVLGAVTDVETGEALGFTTVQVIGETSRGGSINRGALCGRDGRYRLENVPLGRYVLRCSRVGYATYEDSLVVDADREIRRNVELTAQPIEMDKIIVEGDPYAREKLFQPGFISVDAGALADLPGIIEGDPIRSLQLLPGIQAASDISAGLYVRGGGPDQTVVLLDGVPVYNPTHAFGFFSTFNADALAEISLYKGAYPAKYGGRLGAVLDVNSATGNRRKVRGKIGLSTIAARATIEGPVSDGGSWLVAGRRTYLEPLLRALSTDEEPLPTYYFYDFNAKLSSARGNRGGLTLSGYFGKDVINYELDADSELNLTWGNALALARYAKPIGESLFGGFSYALSRYDSNTDLRVLTTPIAVNNSIQDISLRGDLTWQAHPAHRVTTGVLATRYNVYYQQIFNSRLELDFRRVTHEASVFVEDEWSLGDGTALRGGVRLRHLFDGNRWLVEPRISGVRPVTGDVRLKFGAGIYNQYLQLVSTEGFSASDFYVPIDATASPSRSWQSVLGVEWLPQGQKYKLSVEGYYLGLSDLVILDTNSLPEKTGLTAEQIFYTGGTGFQTGVEIFLEKRIGPVTGWVGYTLGWTRRQFDELNRGLKFPPKYDRRHDISIVAMYRKNKWRYGADFIYATGQAFTPVSAQWLLWDPVTQSPGLQLLSAQRNSSRLLPYHRLDVSAARSFRLFGKPAEFFVQIFNLYSRRNDWFVQYNVDNGDFTVEAIVVKQLPIIPSIGINFEF